MDQQNGFDDLAVRKALNLHTIWEANGYRNASNIFNCDFLDDKDPIQSAKLGFAADACIRHRLKAFCGSTGDANSVIPHSHICDGFVEKFGNYRVCYRHIDRARLKDKCVVMSIGSNNIWDFEEAIIGRTGCSTFTVEPRLISQKRPTELPQSIANRSTLYRGFFSNVSNTYSTPPMITYLNLLQYANISMSNNRHEIFKLDCEGCEYTALASIARSPLNHLLPSQILTEFHIQRRPPAVILDLYLSLFQAGYVIFDHSIGDGGCEVGFIRIRDY